MKKTISSWLNVAQASKERRSSGKISSPIPILEFDPITDSSRVKDRVKINLEDIEEEVSYWNSALVCYVLGANPPIKVMEGFFHRIWRDSGVDKVSLLAHGVFVVRFHTIEDRDKVIKGGYVFFDKKPLIMKPWNSKENFCRETLSVLPVWIQLSNLDMKYWRVMRKILNPIGNMVKQDLATRNRERLEYARVLIEVSISQELPEQVIFDNEYGDPVAVGIYYEWRPIICQNCKKMGHTTDKLRKSNKPEQKWLPKEQEAGKPGEDCVNEKGIKHTNVNDRGVIGAKKNSQGVWVARKKSEQIERPEPSGVALKNGFQMLDSGLEMAEEIQIGQILCDLGQSIVGGGDPPIIDG
ncbi:uncharacterized protein LOC133777758 [Humulus lupulus]|uniref:uncharacterized protein LOC133777758 n=1 Tax=Humulus lupulus TaxID=3486 RepID=UPI002B4065A9|nr:uncharacterized protein LOC133777758 [Humulus lupulus]